MSTALCCPVALQQLQHLSSYIISLVDYVLYQICLNQENLPRPEQHVVPQAQQEKNEEKKRRNLSSVVKSTGKWINHITHDLITNMQMDNVLQKRLPPYTGKETTTARKLLQEYNNVSSMVLYSHVPPTKLKNCHLSPNFGNLLHPALIFSGAF